ncbi:hypothetical protein [Hyphomicrobium sp. ghe19]|uniref:hypothetical protein n=1 Tax=Hyphomicrobium sp. ghe19 TaxID=2682968 RepID=UPI00136732D8|nr:hypothetical protein HYPP_02377 [Hyphomicrobium sp. ghe19]
MNTGEKIVIGAICGVALAYFYSAGESYTNNYVRARNLTAEAAAERVERSQEWVSKDRAFRVEAGSVVCEYLFQLDRLQSIASAGALNHNSIAKEGCASLNEGAIVLAADDWMTSAEGPVLFSKTKVMAYIGDTPRLVHIVGRATKVNSTAQR